MIKVMYITSHIQTKGPNNQLRYLLTNVGNSIYPIVCVLGSRYLNENTIEIEKKCKVIYLNYTWAYSLLAAPVKINFLIKKFSVDIVQSFGIRCDFISSLLTKVKKIVVVRNLTMINWSAKGYMGKLVGFFHLQLIKSFDSVIACSAGVQEHLIEYGIESYVINNSIKLKMKDKNTKKRITKLKNFVTASTKHPGKNVEFVIKTFILDSNLEDRTLNIIGFVNQRLQQKYKKYKNIIFHGHIDNPLQFFSDSDCFISASLHEGLPNAVLEALSVHCPVILSDITSHKLIIDGYSEIGRVFTNNCQTSLIEAIKEQESRLDHIDDVTFSELLELRFSPKNMSDRYITQYKNINRF